MKPRNFIVLAAIRAGKKAGAHGKTKKAKRQAEKQWIRQEIAGLK